MSDLRVGADLLCADITAWIAGTSGLEDFVTTIDDAIAASSAS